MLSSRALLLSIVAAAVALVPTQTTRKQSSTALSSWQPNSNFNGKSEARLTDFEREARQADAGARSVEIRKPLGLILDQNGDGDVYVKEVTAGGNAAGMSGQVQKGDVIQMCSATFGGQMWSTRGAGLDRVTRAIEVRAGPTVTLVLQSKAEQRNFLADIFAGQSAAQERRVEEAENKARALEDEVKAERKEAAKGFFGLF
mmetsp:Transcript_26876/g.83616  ORF Transcript_26876/g.83616 Transcript_26876/m.83616 type:complete len:201 (+) Transcript_26876:97-699(+)